MSSQLVSIVVPVYRSELSLPELVERLAATSASSGYPFEVICVDDRSPDLSWSVLLELKARFPDMLRLVRLQKNSGQHNALLCGMNLAQGEIVITMDDDLQNPPEEIPKLIAAIESGFDLAIASYDSKKHSAARNAGGGVVDRVLRLMFHLPNGFQLTSFRAARRAVVQNACRMGGAFPYVTAMLLSQASNQVNVPVRHDPRKFGRSTYNLNRSLALAANLIFSYSSYPLYFVAMLCGLAFLLAASAAAFVICQTLVFGSTVPGWASTFVIVASLNGLSLLSLLIFGIYLSRLNAQITRAKTRFTISEQVR